jgi:hypothetical protein
MPMSIMHRNVTTKHMMINVPRDILLNVCFVLDSPPYTEPRLNIMLLLIVGLPPRCVCVLGMWLILALKIHFKHDHPMIITTHLEPARLPCLDARMMFCTSLLVSVPIDLPSAPTRITDIMNQQPNVYRLSAVKV